MYMESRTTSLKNILYVKGYLFVLIEFVVSEDRFHSYWMHLGIDLGIDKSGKYFLRASLDLVNIQFDENQSKNKR